MKGKQLTGGYLYQDGHAVLSYRRTVRDGSAILSHDVVEIHERYTDARLLFTGRVTFHQYNAAPFLELCRRAEVIRCELPTSEAGSEKTRSMGLIVGSLTFEMQGSGYLSFDDIRRPGEYGPIVGCGYTYQPDIVEAFSANLREWGSSPVARIVRVKSEDRQTAVA